MPQQKLAAVPKLGHVMQARARRSEGPFNQDAILMTISTCCRAGFGTALGFAVLLIGASGAYADCSEQAISLIKKLDGSWRGSGTVKPIGGGQERLSCRVRYRIAGPKVEQNISCAGTDYRFEAEAKIACDGDSVSGSWSESVANNSGSASGKISGDKLSIEVTGPNFKGFFNVRVAGTRHDLSITQFDPAAGRNVPVATVSLSK
jgi:hypothetical protein